MSNSESSAFKLQTKTDIVLEQLTPAYDGVPVEVSPLREKGFHQQREEVEALYEEPEVVGHHTVVEKHHDRFTSHLLPVGENNK